MGIRLSTTADVILEEVHVPEDHLLGAEGKGFKLAMQTLDRTRLECAAMAAGLSQRAIDLSVDYAKTRVTFGKPIAKLQAIQFMPCRYGNQEPGRPGALYISALR